MTGTCRDCKHCGSSPNSEPCVSCLERLAPGEPLLFSNFEAKNEEE